VRIGIRNVDEDPGIDEGAMKAHLDTGSRRSCCAFQQDEHAVDICPGNSAIVMCGNMIS
jgi:hypothetical protein